MCNLLGRCEFNFICECGYLGSISWWEIPLPYGLGLGFNCQPNIMRINEFKKSVSCASLARSWNYFLFGCFIVTVLNGALYQSRIGWLYVINSLEVGNICSLSIFLSGSLWQIVKELRVTVLLVTVCLRWLMLFVEVFYWGTLLLRFIARFLLLFLRALLSMPFSS